MKKRILTLVLAVILIISTASFAFAATPTIKKTSYKGSGIVEVDFAKDVQYKNLKVTVTDSAKKSYTVTVKEKDKDDVKFYVKGIKSSTKYTYKISGVRNSGSGSYITLTGTFTTPAATTASLKVKKVSYDSADKELEFDFSTKVQYKNLKVTVTDSAKKSYKTTIVEKDNDELDVRVSGLSEGKSYTYKITGIRKSGTSAYVTLSGTFKTPQKKLAIKKAEYDREDKELEIDFSTKVQYKNLKVTVKDSAGKACKVTVAEKDNDSIELRATLKKGAKYTVTVSGVRISGSGNYVSLSKTFAA